jgi:hypothetical protein
MTKLRCSDERRRGAVRKEPLNGLDYLEVGDDARSLTVYFLGKAPEGLTRANVRITGGQRVRGIEVIDIDIHRHDDPERDDCMVVTLDRTGDFSTYRLCVVALDERYKPTDRPFQGFDRRYACLDFSFMASCPSDLDCAPHAGCEPRQTDQPDINYLAKDYASFRQLLLDRLAVIAPDWRERHVPDLGITLVELLAYVGDHLSYYQDAVATEAYLETARRRTSVRRHVRLVDYWLHEGCNARAWLAVTVVQDALTVPAGTFYLTTAAGALAGSMHREEDLPRDRPPAYLVFEPISSDDRDTVLRSARNEIAIYTWGDVECCLAVGATSAVLLDSFFAPTRDTVKQTKQYPQPTPPRPPHTLDLQIGDVLILEEVKGPRTGVPADADRTHRHAVRLTKAFADVDPLYNALIWHVEWDPEDALPFSVCVSSVGTAPKCEPITGVTVVRGNVLLVDHGRWVHEDLGRVPSVTIYPECGDDCVPALPQEVAGPFAPSLHQVDVTFGEPIAFRRLDPCGYPGVASAAALLRQDPRKASPQVRLSGIPSTPDGSAAFSLADLADPTRLAHSLARDTESPQARWLRGQISRELIDAVSSWSASGSGPLPAALQESLTEALRAMQQTWLPRHDLLASGPDDRHFVVEVDDERRASLRFGNGVSGKQPDANTWFRASYRIGSGTMGNVGPDSISHIVFRTAFPSGTEIRVRNPMPAHGGVAPEPVEEAKRLAPSAYRRTLERAIVPADYARLVMRDFAATVQRAAATMRWTGSSPEIIVAIDPFAPAQGAHAVNDDAADGLLHAIGCHLQRYRRIGHDVRIAWARYVPIDLALTVCVLPGHLRGQVKAALLEALGSRRLRDGRRGLFHPDSLTFGDGIYLSQVVAAAQAVPGVESVRVDKLERLYEGPGGELENGVLPLGPLEVGRMDNDPSFPERGRLTLTLRGGR